jgi:hypothetical protein
VAVGPILIKVSDRDLFPIPVTACRNIVGLAGRYICAVYLASQDAQASRQLAIRRVPEGHKHMMPGLQLTTSRLYNVVMMPMRLLQTHTPFQMTLATPPKDPRDYSCG